MSRAADARVDRCSTCGDIAEPGRVVTLHGREATVELDSGACVTVAVDLVPGVTVGQTVLVHGGVAIGSGASAPRPEDPARRS